MMKTHKDTSTSDHSEVHSTKMEHEEALQQKQNDEFYDLFVLFFPTYLYNESRNMDPPHTFFQRTT